MSFNGNNVPDDCRHSDFWDEPKYVCPECDDGMTLIDGDKLKCDNKDCAYEYDIDGCDPDEPDNDYDW